MTTHPHSLIINLRNIRRASRNPPVMSRWKETFQSLASQLYTPSIYFAYLLHHQPRGAALPWPPHTLLSLNSSFFPSLNHITSVWAWTTSQLSMVLAPTSACTSLHAGCSLANISVASGDREEDTETIKFLELDEGPPSGSQHHDALAISRSYS